MVYVLDANVFITIFNNYYPSSSPEIFEGLDILIQNHKIISVREVKNEILVRDGRNNLTQWVKSYPFIFEIPSLKETRIVKEIYEYPKFREGIKQKKFYSGGFSADAFVVAKAKAKSAVVVTREIYKPNAEKIPNICEALDVSCIGFEDFLIEVRNAEKELPINLFTVMSS